MQGQELQQTLHLAARHHQAGRLIEAEKLYLRVLQAQDSNPEANHNLGVIAMQTGRGLKVALPLFQRAWRSKPTHQQHWQSFVRALAQAGDQTNARRVYEDGRKRGLKGPDPQLLQAQNQKPAATDGDAPANKAEPNTAHADIATLLQQGKLHYQNGMYRETELAMRRILAAAPDTPGAKALLARALLELYRPEEAAQACRAALQQQPDSADFYVLLAQAMDMLGQDEDAIGLYRQALTLDKGLIDAYRALGTMLFERQRYADILPLCRQMIQTRPDYAPAYSDYGTALQSCGRMDEAMKAYQQALKLRPDDLDTRSNWLFCSNYQDDVSEQEIYEQAVTYGKYASARATAFTQWSCDNNPQRLRVGLVSGDLRDHPVGYFLENVIANSDRSRVEWFAYATHSKSDALTQRLKPHMARWTALAGINHEDCARQIHADAPHILIDLSGHSAHTILPAFAWRPAPLQVSWLGYFATTGLAEMDFFIADPVSVPTEEQRHYSEQVWPIEDTRLCFAAPRDAPEVAPPPCLERGYVTFGSFQKLAKISDASLACWADVLHACPDSRLRIQCKGLDDESTRRALIARAEHAGIASERLELLGRVSRERYLASHAEVDILLDSFPFSGGTTTCEALWMGVPTVTLAGKRLVSRQGASLLGAAGLDDWVAHSKADYIQLVVDKASNTGALRTLRANLRSQVSASALFDGKLFAQRLDEALWAMWRTRQ